MNAQHRRARRFHGFGDGDELVLALHRARSRDKLEVPSAEEVSAHVHNRVFGVEFAVRVLERFLDALYALHDVERTYEVLVHDGSVADEPHNCGVVALAHMDVQPQSFYPFDEVVHLFFVGIVFDYDNHFCLSFNAFAHKQKTATVWRSSSSRSVNDPYPRIPKTGLLK